MKLVRPIILIALLFSGVFIYQRFIATRDHKIVGMCEAYGTTGPVGGTCTPKPTIPSPSPTTKVMIDKKAAFAIFTHSTFRVFTSSMYHNRAPDVFIQSDNPNIVHVKKDDIRWGDFFGTLPFKLTSTCLTTGTGQTFCTEGDNTLKFYLNGVQDLDALSKKIQDRDRLLVSFGPIDDPNIPAQLERVSQVD